MKAVPKARCFLPFLFAVIFMVFVPDAWAAKPSPAPKTPKSTPLPKSASPSPGPASPGITSKPGASSKPGTKPGVPDHATLASWLKESLQVWNSWASSKSFRGNWSDNEGTKPKELLTWEKTRETIENQTYFLPQNQVKAEWLPSRESGRKYLAVSTTNPRIPLKYSIPDTFTPKDGGPSLKDFTPDPETFRKAALTLSYRLEHSWQGEWLITRLSLEIKLDGQKTDSNKMVIPVGDSWILDADSPDHVAVFDTMEVAVVPLSNDANEAFAQIQPLQTPPSTSRERSQRARDLVKGTDTGINPAPTEAPARTSGNLLMARTETSAFQYWQVMTKAGYAIQAPDAYSSRLPATQVSWIDAARYCNALSVQQGLSPVYLIDGDKVESNFSNNGWRLPTESEWDHAAGADKSDDRFFDLDPGAFPELFDARAWTWSNTDRLREVGLKKANFLGLCDMYGNAAEWCQDWYSRKGSHLPGGNQVENPDKIIKGGSWMSPPEDLRMGARRSMSARTKSLFVGFRVVRMQPVPTPPSQDTRKKTKS